MVPEGGCSPAGANILHMGRVLDSMDQGAGAHMARHRMPEMRALVGGSHVSDHILRTNSSLVGNIGHIRAIRKVACALASPEEGGAGKHCSELEVEVAARVQVLHRAV